MANGEITITDLRLLLNSFPDELARKNIFEAGNLEKSAQLNKQFQIDELGFARFLQAEAKAKGRPYGEQNRQNDATYLGTVMRLRRGSRSRDVGESKFIFVTSNSFLARCAKRFLVKEKQLAPQHVAAMLSLGQIATIAWLLKDQKLTPAKAGRELLINCYSAIRPDSEWFRHFREGLEKVVGPVDEYVADRERALVVQAARRISTEESFGNSQILRELSIAEIIGRAEADAMKKLATEEERRKEQEEESKAERLAHEFHPPSSPGKSLIPEPEPAPRTRRGRPAHPLRPVPHRPAPPRPRLLRPDRPGPRPGRRWGLPPAHRGPRPHPLPPRMGGPDL
jgi:hypothetical protein